MQYGVYEPSRFGCFLWTTGEAWSTKTAIPYAVDTQSLHGRRRRGDASPMTQTIPGSAAHQGFGDPPVAEGNSGAHLVAKALDAEGVDTVHPLSDGCVDVGIDPADIAPAPQLARESGLPPLVDGWVDPDGYAPGPMNQTTYK
jgi:hypothetical protein